MAHRASGVKAAPDWGYAIIVVRMRSSATTLLTIGSTAFALVAAFYNILAPVPGIHEPQSMQPTFTDVHGLWVIIPVMFPVFISIIPLVLPQMSARIAATVTMFGFAFVSGMSIGLYYVPAGLMELAATCAASSREPRY